MRGIFSHYVARKSKLYWSTLGLEKYVTHVSCLNRSPKEAGALKKFEKLKPRGQMDGDADSWELTAFLRSGDRSLDKKLFVGNCLKKFYKA